MSLYQFITEEKLCDILCTYVSMWLCGSIILSFFAATKNIN
ncbi:MAG: hypothetical protein JWQ30_361 [Sediminibacterium sp.]|nr:hypothetical protein [Sediminibacterium sp.]